MKPIEFRLNMFAVALTAITIFLCWLVIDNFRELKTARTNLLLSHHIQETVRNLDKNDFQKEIQKQLQDWRPQLQPPELQQGLTSVIEAYSTDTHRMLEERMDQFLKNDSMYCDHLEKEINYLQTNIIYFVAMGCVLTLIGVMLMRNYLIGRVFKPLHDLRRQMSDFLNGQYSYRFSVPSHDEIGDLQTSFNSMAQKVLQNMEELKALDSAKSEFLNIASHELRTPMTSIKGSLGLVSSGVMGDMPNSVTELLAIAESETDRLIRLINDILDMAKIEAGRLTLKPTWNSLGGMLQKTVSSLRGLSEKANVTIELTDHAAYDVFMDSDRIQQVLTNLLSNALKFSPKDGKVWVRVQVDYDNQLLVEVIDQGRGISPEDQAQIFQKFRQATNSENLLVKGTGLGLSIAKALVEEHSGKLGLYSQPGRGSNFFFTLPEFRLATGGEVININAARENKMKNQKGSAA
jgi:signal transduction histidine kinase